MSCQPEVEAGRRNRDRSNCFDWLESSARPSVFCACRCIRQARCPGWVAELAGSRGSSAPLPHSTDSTTFAFQNWNCLWLKLLLPITELVPSEWPCCCCRVDLHPALLCFQRLMFLILKTQFPFTCRLMVNIAVSLFFLFRFSHFQPVTSNQKFSFQ